MLPATAILWVALYVEVGCGIIRERVGRGGSAESIRYGACCKPRFMATLPEPCVEQRRSNE